MAEIVLVIREALYISRSSRGGKSGGRQPFKAL